MIGTAVLTVLVGVAVALFGWMPGWRSPLTWGSRLLDLLPFSATPTVPLDPLRWTPLVAMTLLAAALVWAGLDRFARRDLQPA